MKRILLILAILSLNAGAYAQSIRDVKINEVLVLNQDSYMDGYGHRSSWIELHNTSHGRIKINGCYLKVRKTDGEEISYRIPNDPNAELGPLGYTVFFCDGSSTKGTFYTNFTLEDVEMIWFMNANGKEMLDQMPVDIATLIPNVSLGRYTEENGIVVTKTLSQTTPLATNDMEDTVPKHERFRRMDPSGGIMAVTAVFVVFSALLVLFLVFKWFGNYMVRLAERKQKRESEKLAKAKGVEKISDIPKNSEEIAAIAMALRLYMEDIHDRESEVITINRVARTYSPWSSKIYGMRQIPFRK